MDQDFSVDYVDSDEYRYLGAEIYFRKQRLCQLFRRFPGDEIDIEFVDDLYVVDAPVRRRFPLLEFLKLVDELQADLLSLPRIENDTE